MSVDPKIAHYVVGGRCACCGHKGNSWPPEKIVDACKKWAGEHDGRPPIARNWDKGTVSWPAKTTVEAVFGSWNRMLAASGFTIRPHGSREYWSRDTMANAMLDWTLRHGRWPTTKQWERAVGPTETGRPSTSSIVKRFGSWEAAKRHAGWIPESERPVYVEWSCVECGTTDREGQTIGCDTCARRSYEQRRKGSRKRGLAAPRQALGVRAGLEGRDPRSVEAANCSTSNATERREP